MPVRLRLNILFAILADSRNIAAFATQKKKKRMPNIQYGEEGMGWLKIS